jgi:tetraprenyl-beta-curcumene synthase
MNPIRARARRRALSDALAIVETLACYWLTIFPVARRELHRWRTRATAIPDPTLRELASRALAQEGLNAEGAALFATLAPARRRPAATRLLVAFQVMYDYLDALTEQPRPDPLTTSRRLHGALIAALGGPTTPDGFFANYPVAGGDGGYLTELADSCRAIFLELPSARAVAPDAIRAAVRSAEGQSQSHAAALGAAHDLTRWAAHTSPAGLDLRWWETAAAAESSLVIHALLASAAQSNLTKACAASVAAAYWPWIAGLNALLDDLIDTAEDATEGTHSFIARYRTATVRAQRLSHMATEANSAIDRLPLRRRHAVIFGAMTSYYLAAPEACAGETAATARLVTAAIDMDLRPLVAMLRARRRMRFGRGEP